MKKKDDPETGTLGTLLQVLCGLPPFWYQKNWRIRLNVLPEERLILGPFPCLPEQEDGIDDLLQELGIDPTTVRCAIWGDTIPLSTKEMPDFTQLYEFTADKYLYNEVYTYQNGSEEVKKLWLILTTKEDADLFMTEPALFAKRTHLQRALQLIDCGDEVSFEITPKQADKVKLLQLESRILKKERTETRKLQRRKKKIRLNAKLPLD